MHPDRTLITVLTRVNIIGAAAMVNVKVSKGDSTNYYVTSQ